MQLYFYNTALRMVSMLFHHEMYAFFIQMVLKDEIQYDSILEVQVDFTIL